MEGSRKMDAQLKAVVVECSRASEEDRTSFVEVVKKLMEAGVESYLTDFRRRTKTYYLPSGEFFEVPAEGIAAQPAAKFHQPGIEAAIREAQANKPDSPTRASARRFWRPVARATSSRSRAAARSISDAPRKPTSSCSRRRNDGADSEPPRGSKSAQQLRLFRGEFLFADYVLLAKA
ncbi:MAG: hypothetical protein WAV18_31075, partial [Roseiarcus sp.]